MDSCKSEKPSRSHGRISFSQAASWSFLCSDSPSLAAKILFDLFLSKIKLSYLYATYINHHILPKLLCLKATSAEILYSEIEESELSDASSTNLKEDRSSPSLTLIRKQGWYSDKISYLKGKVPSSIGILTSVALPFEVFEKVLLDDSNQK
ncbi:alpha-glucan water dikinase, chloroplastic-like [Magnolia sinica]|uniref:alpha-glucan water dikinase, chloroplastic-like n=1 Tax=Magnolia sinica TaxID=86752 RepID=UPI00265B1466|nr:alpha-glucan water dikinase, chloroplastic-like [Magnolia sinica]